MYARARVYVCVCVELFLLCKMFLQIYHFRISVLCVVKVVIRRDQLRETANIADLGEMLQIPYKILETLACAHVRGKH